jgi:hypothetical protein
VTAPIPSDFWGRIRQMISDEVAKFFRSGPLRNASISDGGLTIRGGFFRLLFGNVQLFYLGPVNPPLPDGRPQQGWIVKRADGTTVLDLRDADVADGLVLQALNWRDRQGNVVLADDTNSGQGLARPYLQAAFYPARFGDYLGSTSGSFETLYRAELPKQQPRLRVAAIGAADSGGTTGEMRCLIEGAQFGATVTLTNAVQAFGIWGPEFLPDIDHMETMHVEIQARRTAGAGVVRVAPTAIQGMQS